MPLIGANAVIKKDTVAIGYAQGCRIGISADLIKEYKIGDQKPAVLEFGNRSFPVSLDMMYIDKTYANLILNGTTFDLVVLPAGSGDTYTVDDVVLTSWEMTITQDGVILESCRGEGKSITLPV